MPRSTDRQQEVANYLQGFRVYRKVKEYLARRRARRARQEGPTNELEDPYTADVDFEFPGLSDNSHHSSVSTDSSSFLSTSSISSNEPISSHDTSSESTSSNLSGPSSSNSIAEDGDELMHSLSEGSLHDSLSGASLDSRMDVSGMSGSSSEPDSSDSGYESDESGRTDTDGFDSDGGVGEGPGGIAGHVRAAIHSLFSTRYRVRRKHRHRPVSLLREALRTADQYPEEFRQQLRVTPTTFRRLVSELETDPVFRNNSQNDQMPVEHQVAITLYRFGHYGNSASVSEVARWAGYGTGTILLVTRRVIQAMLRPSFRNRAVRRPTAEEKEEAKRWVEHDSCRGWRDGWCMVDGTLVPLYACPHWYGQSYFDRKGNYSLNIQVCYLAISFLHLTFPPPAAVETLPPGAGNKPCLIFGSSVMMPSIWLVRAKSHLGMISHRLSPMKEDILDGSSLRLLNIRCNSRGCSAGRSSLFGGGTAVGFTLWVSHGYVEV
ncbi:hypothetical protein BKA70DRAFT_239536 [Coprinopsis sp. MPI-PUGE-AT-0042]|nr:hypothetical protein BKA70DRAFT_239536 [Coprinopsis sp. MPI-PUGE-AT-0042]